MKKIFYFLIIQNNFMKVFTKEKLSHINIYAFLTIFFLISIVLCQFHLFYSLFLITLGVSYLLSYKLQKYSTLILHYVNPFLILYLQSWGIWILLTDRVVPPDLLKTFFIISVCSFYTFNFVFLFLFKEQTPLKIKNFNESFYKLVKIISFLALLIYILIIFQSSGLGNKRQIKDFIFQNSYLGYLYAFSNLFIICLLYELFKVYNKRKEFYKKLIFQATIFLFIYLVLGERDLLFTYIIGYFFIISFKKGRFWLKKYYLFILVLTLLGHYTQLFKSYMFQDQAVDISDNSFYNNGFDDFMTTGLNIERVYRINKLQALDRNMILSDLGNVVGVSMNSGKWFNYVFLNRGIGYTGYGFSFPLLGYLDFKIFGVFILYFILAVISSKVFNYLNGNILGLSFIIFFISLIIYIQRQDLAYFLNLTIKFVLIPYFLMTFIKKKKIF